MHKRVWRYLGDLRCPCHNVYQKTYASGRGDNIILRMKCKATGKIWMKTLYSHWVGENEFNECDDARHEDLERMALQLKGGKMSG